MSNYKEFPKLFKYTNKNQIQQWQIFVENDTFFTIEGIMEGKLTQSLPTVCKGKNLGKKNETTPENQAIAEAQAKWQKKVDGGYNEILTVGSKFLEPMLAFEYDKYPIDWKAVTEGKEKVFVQPKLDGLRCINEKNTQMSRNGKPYVATPHLNQDEVTLDGELYSHEYKEDFNKIVSLCKKQKPATEELEEARQKVQYWVYDMPYAKGTFLERFEQLLIWYSDKYMSAENSHKKSSIKLVSTKEVFSQDELDECHAKNLADGYEGTIIRRDNAEYEFKRSKQLLKYKDFKDEEFKIIGFEEGTGGRAGTIGYFIMQHDKVDNQTFKSNVKGNFDYLKQVWSDRESYIGKTATVKYFNRTPKSENGGDVPRFPFIIKIDRESFE